jgi:hypothetical protein
MLTIQELESLAKTCAILVGGWWAYWRFVRQREAHPKIEFQVNARPLGRQGGRLLLEVSASMKNVGAVRHRTPEFTLNIRYLLGSDQVGSGGAAINYQTLFPHSTNEEIGLSQRSFILWNSFVEPGVTQAFTYIADVPQAATFILILSEFRYDDKARTPHSAQKVIFVGEKKEASQTPDPPPPSD